MTIRDGIRLRLKMALANAMQSADIKSFLRFAEVLHERGYKGFRQQDLLAWSKGRVPGLDRLPVIAEALGTTHEWLLIGEKAETSGGLRDPIIIERGGQRFPFVIATYIETTPEGISRYTFTREVKTLSAAVTIAKDIKEKQKL